MNLYLRNTSFTYKIAAALLTAAFFVLPVYAAVDEAAILEAHTALFKVYEERGDLQRLFGVNDWLPINPAETGDIIDLEDWAKKYGYKEYPTRLKFFDFDGEARAMLSEVFLKRADLQQFFDAETWESLGFSQTAGITDLEDWARKYGYKEHAELAQYAPQGSILEAVPGAQVARREVNIPLPPALTIRSQYPTPIAVDGASFDFDKITAEKVLVIDANSRRVIISRGVNDQRVMASITKLMTAMVVLDKRISFASVGYILDEDNIGGARVRVTEDIPITIGELFFTMLVGSANNAAHALARIGGGGDVEKFVELMNMKAKALGLENTVFVDPSGLEVENYSNANDIAALLIEAMLYPSIRRAVSTSFYDFVAGGTPHRIKNTNELLTNNNNNLYVLGGKTGYLIESQWNLVVRMTNGSRTEPELIVVVLGSQSRPDSFVDSQRLAEWVWSPNPKNIVWQ